VPEGTGAKLGPPFAPSDVRGFNVGAFALRPLAFGYEEVHLYDRRRVDY